MRELKLFLSYHSSDKSIAGKIKQCLTNYGLNVFLAHEDIRPTEEWQTRILTELKRADIFLPLLTDKFLTSKWTSQECGIAIAKGTFIISLKVSVDPFGFLSKYQAFNFKTENVQRSCVGITKVIHRNKKFQKKFLDGLITSISRCSSFFEAIERISLLNQFDGYNRRQVNEIIRVSTDNPQIYKSFVARRKLETFFKKNSEKVDDGLLKNYRKKCLIVDNR
jgi:hypothetical protein